MGVYLSKQLFMRYLNNKLYFLVFILLLCVNFTGKTQQELPIKDFYIFANEEWLNKTVLPAKSLVINNWGIAWDSICSKSIEILAGNSDYKLQGKYLNSLNQLRIFYRSSIKHGNSKQKSLQLIQQHFPMLFGYLFSEITFIPEKQTKINELIVFLKQAYHDKISKSQNINDDLRTLFLLKLELMQLEIGAPQFKSLPDIQFPSTDDFIANQEYANKQKPVKTNWNVPPYETDCRYNFQSNCVKICAGSLYDSMLFDEKDMAYLYATLGRTIAHEMTHAFDNTGKNFDEKGKQIRRKTQRTESPKLNALYEKITNQYNSYSVGEGLMVDGAKTLQENIADLGGLEIALHAFKLYLKEKRSGITDVEYVKSIREFYISYAQFWREKASPEFIKTMVNRMHTPQKFRAIGTFIIRMIFTRYSILIRFRNTILM